MNIRRHITPIKATLLITIISIIFCFLTSYFSKNIYLLLFYENAPIFKYIVKFWDSKTISNLNLYLFASQIALTVLLATAISFISHLLEEKYYGYKVKELIMYTPNQSFTIIDRINMSFTLIFASLLLLMIRHSEMPIILIFGYTLYNAIRVFKIIFELFFYEGKIKNNTINIIKEELDAVKKTIRGEDSMTILSENYSKVEKVLDRIKEHTMVLIDNFDKSYMDNINFIATLWKIKVKSLNSIETSVLYGGFVEDIINYLYEKKLDRELKSIISNNIIWNNCNPKVIMLENADISNMYSSFFCQALNSCFKNYTNLLISNFDNNMAKINELQYLVIEKSKYIFELTSNYTNPAYERMIQNNWKHMIVYTMVMIERSGGEQANDLLTNYIDLIAKMESNAVEILNLYSLNSKNNKIKKYCIEIIESKNQ